MKGTVQSCRRSRDICRVVLFADAKPWCFARRTSSFRVDARVFCAAERRFDDVVRYGFARDETELWSIICDAGLRGRTGLVSFSRGRSNRRRSSAKINAGPGRDERRDSIVLRPFSGVCYRRRASLYIRTLSHRHSLRDATSAPRGFSLGDTCSCVSFRVGCCARTVRVTAAR